MSETKQLTIIWVAAVLSGIFCFWYINNCINDNVKRPAEERSIYAR